MAKVKFFNNRVMFDDWGSFLSGFNKMSNKAKVKFVDNTVWFDDATLDSLWLHDGYTHRIISCVAEDMVNKGFTITGDAANIDMREADRLNITGVMYEAMCKSQLHGGAAILLGVDDGQPLDMPIAVNAIKNIKFLRVIPKPNITPDNVVDSDPLSADYGKPEYYTITDTISTLPYKVHRSRLFLFPWLEFSSIKSRTQEFRDDLYSMIWGTSVVEQMYKQIGHIAIFGDSISHLSQEAVIGKYKLAGLAQMFAMGADGEKKVMKRLDIINTAKSVINGVILDADSQEDYTRDSLQFSGMNGVADTLMIFLSGVSGIPVTRLFGRSPAGLDSSGDSDMKIYYDMIAAYQKTMLTAFLKKVVFYIDKYKKAITIEEPTSQTKTAHNGTNVGTSKRIRPVTETDIDILWNPLYQMTEKEKAETYFTNAEADTMYVQNGIISKEEVRVARFLGGYNAYVSVETADVPKMEGDLTTNKEEQPEPDAKKE